MSQVVLFIHNIPLPRVLKSLMLTPPSILMKTNLNKLSSLSLLAMLGAASGFVASSASAATLISEWNFDSSDLVNSVDTTFNGTGVGTVGYASSTLFGGGGQALDISAALSAMRVGNSASGDGINNYSSTFDDLTSFSVSFWVKAAADDSSTSDDAWTVIASKGNQTASGWVIRKKGNDNNAVGQIDTDQTSIGNSFDAAWHHIVMTVNGPSSVSYYFDNGAAITNNTISYLADASLPLLFGANWENGLRSLNGQLDEIKIYSGVLDATEVSNLYNTNAIPEPGSYALLAGLAGMAFVMARRRI
jgi:hypothetical protein